MALYDDKFIDDVLNLFKEKHSLSCDIDSMQEKSPLDDIDDSFYIDDILNHISNVSGLLKKHTDISIEILELLKYDMRLFELFQQLTESIIAENYNACSIIKRQITE
jgi:hypothetical protein